MPGKQYDTAAVSRTRRQRGYRWEDTLVKRLSAVDGWSAFRLGSPSTALPDVLAVGDGELLVIEAKSGTAHSLYVPAMQIKRCKRWTETFTAYDARRVVLAFKFLSKKRVATGVYTQRSMREYYLEWVRDDESEGCVCTYDGEMYAYAGGRRTPINHTPYMMPFLTKSGA